MTYMANQICSRQLEMETECTFDAKGPGSGIIEVISSEVKIYSKYFKDIPDPE